MAVRMTQAIDCRTPYTFKVELKIEERYPKTGSETPKPTFVNHDNMDKKCHGDTVEVAFRKYNLQYTLSDLMGKQFTVSLPE
eukprot:3644818-Rhodomonas_salina.2